jgi:hypothetical protein
VWGGGWGGGGGGGEGEGGGGGGGGGATLDGRDKCSGTSMRGVRVGVPTL